MICNKNSIEYLDNINKNVKFKNFNLIGTFKNNVRLIGPHLYYKFNLHSSLMGKERLIMSYKIIKNKESIYDI